ncbi:hypothetical protein FOA43_003741 [Brettanomyces nanus]|uniref:Uncharacterized protein n=1 Tax=Eeniella nana TaxID=13502 RepID=A0A875S5Z9_EENNA|nr:uncharacterized protein FOA43_003741 [Brettanomyces nanus]QPG76353.1 hypothetical protein FOA43_003741 [Brettanomyces nanus]
MTILDTKDKEKVKRTVPKPSNKIIDATVARLYIAFPDSSSWVFTGLSGAIALVDDLVGHSFFFKLVDISGNRGVLWDQELYVDFQYNQDRLFFHTFELDDCLAGLLFENKSDAQNFYKRVTHRQKYASKQTLQNKKAIELKRKPQAEVAQVGLRGDMYTDDESQQTTRSGILNEQRQRRIHNIIYYDKEPPPEWRSLYKELESVGITEDMIAENREFIKDYIAKRGGPLVGLEPPVPRKYQYKVDAKPATIASPRSRSGTVGSSSSSRRKKAPPPPPPGVSAGGRKASSNSVTTESASGSTDSLGSIPEPAASARSGPGSTTTYSVPPLPAYLQNNSQQNATAYSVPPPLPPSQQRPVPAVPFLPPRGNPVVSPFARVNNLAPPPPPSRNNGSYQPFYQQQPSQHSGNRVAPPPPPPRRAGPPPPPHRNYIQSQPPAQITPLTPPRVPPVQLQPPPTSFPTLSFPPPPARNTTAYNRPAAITPQAQETPAVVQAPDFMTPTASVFVPPPPPPLPSTAPSSVTAAPPPPPAASSGPFTPSLPSTDPGRGALLQSIRSAGGLNALKKTDKAHLDKPSVILQEVKGDTPAPTSSAGGPAGQPATLADALAAALNKRKNKVAQSDDEDDEW